MQVIVGGELVAETRRPTLLFETGMPTRYYMPISDTRLNLLSSSSLISRCPYKGVANYYNLKIGRKCHENIAWYYPDPVLEVSRIKGLLSFYDEIVEAVVVDGVEQSKPVTAACYEEPQIQA